MGWGRMLLLGNVGQQLDLSDMQAEIDEMRSQIRGGGATEVVLQLQRENDELRLYIAALVRLLAAKGIMTPDELSQLFMPLMAKTEVLVGNTSTQPNSGRA